ncbi:MAG TPA: ABC transporter substrate-binding protein [Solirubrobacteraceae bacterium]|nr:ABC transporter substrate-binding protein [Solirubrobacteraceae bacterium]
MRNATRWSIAVIGTVFVLLAAAACGSSSSSSGSASSGSGSSTGSSQTSSAAPTAGPGLTSPTSPTGAKQTGGTVYYTEGAGATPNYIFPMTTAQVCGTQNISQLNAILYRPLYWYGNDYKPTIDYDDSIGQQPTFSDNNQTVTIKLNPWKWSDGETVTSRDVMLWINLYKADPSKNYCGYVPGYFPDNVTSVQAPNPQTVVLHLNKSYNPEWFTYNELSQIYPIPLAWDRTSLSAPAPTSDNGHLPDATKAGAENVYKFLDAQSKDLGTWATSPLWSVVDGPFKLQSFTTTAQVTLVPNPDYSGSPKPTISKFVELPFTSDAAIFNEIRSGGPSAITVGNLPAAYAPQSSTVEGEGYVLNRAASYSFNYFPFNLNNPKVGPIFRQLYFRQAFQHLIDQQGWIHAFLHDTAIPTYGPVPVSPESPLASVNASTNPYVFSTQAAATILSSHGWKVAPNGSTTCEHPGTAANECGAGITSGEGISFNIDYQSGVAAIESEMNDLAAQAKRVGININLTTHPFTTVIGTAIACQPSQADCNWTAENWGAGWIYAPDFLPTGESLFGDGAVANYESYADPHATQLIDSTITGSATGEAQALSSYAQYIEQQVPVVFGPTSIGSYQGDAGTLVAKNLGGYAANAFGYMTPEDWYFTK